MKMWRVNFWGSLHITCVNIERVTKSCVFVNGRRWSRKTYQRRWFETFPEAKAFYVSKLLQDIQRSSSHTKSLTERLERIIAMQEDEFIKEHSEP